MVDHDCGGNARGYWREAKMRDRRLRQFWEIENLSLRGWRLSSSSILSLQKWIESVWSGKMIAKILSKYLGVWDRCPWNNYVFQFGAVLSILTHFGESDGPRSTSTSPSTFRTRYFSLSLLLPSQKLISLITSTLLPAVKFQLFEDFS
jgi:hypothetical protein